MNLDSRIRELLTTATVEGSELRLAGQLDRADYVAVNKALEALGGKWNRKAKAHIFEADPTSAIDIAISTGEVTRPQDYGFFETPEPLIERMLDLAGIMPEFNTSNDPRERQRVLEPSAGKGRIVRAIHKRDDALAFAYELLPANAANVDISLYPEGRCVIADFLTVEPNPVFDAVVMNPPFARQDDIRHVMHAFKFLRTGGKLVSVMSAGVLFRENSLTKSFRSFVEERGGTVERLPEGTFKESGTMVNTCLVVLQ